MDKNERKSMIKVRGGFSERIGKPTCAVTIQLDEFDDRTRTFISNLLFDFLQITFQNAEQFRKQPYGNISTPLSSDFCKDLGQDVFSFCNHLKEGYVYKWDDFYTTNIENVLNNASYNEVLDLLEYIHSTGITLSRLRLYPDSFLSLYFIVPPITEQKEIADYLDTKCAEIDRLIAKKEQLVKELESYKKSLIYEVVTGKREV